MNYNKLHIYGQVYNHDHAFIVGSKTALEALRDAIQATLDGSARSSVMFAADDEGYEVKVYLEEEDAYWDKAKLPYTDNDYFVGNDDDIGPWDLFKKHKDKH